MLYITLYHKLYIIYSFHFMPEASECCTYAYTAFDAYNTAARNAFSGGNDVVRGSWWWWWRGAGHGGGNLMTGGRAPSSFFWAGSRSSIGISLPGFSCLYCILAATAPQLATGNIFIMYYVCGVLCIWLYMYTLYITTCYIARIQHT